MDFSICGIKMGFPKYSHKSAFMHLYLKINSYNKFICGNSRDMYILHSSH